MKILGVSLTSLVILFVVFYLGTRFPNALRIPGRA